MPLYEYECDACGRRFELIQKFADAPADVCASCGKGPVRRLLSSPAIQFKGSGWYITDYAKKGKSESPSSPDTAAGTASGESAAKETSTAPTGSSDASSSAAKTGTEGETKTESKPSSKDSPR
jgi:putative FmdB family regulatory protein